MRIKVNGGTAHSGSLCISCKFSEQVNFQNGSTRNVCSNYSIVGHSGPKAIQAEVGQCTGFRDKSHIDLHQLMHMAWIIETKNRQIGFTRPGKMSEEQRDKYLDEINVEEL